MSDENLTVDTGPRSLVVELERRRNRIVKAKRSFEVIADAYNLVLADLRSASGESDHAGGNATA